MKTRYFILPHKILQRLLLTASRAKPKAKGTAYLNSGHVPGRPRAPATPTCFLFTGHPQASPSLKRSLPVIPHPGSEFFRASTTIWKCLFSFLTYLPPISPHRMLASWGQGRDHICLVQLRKGLEQYTCWMNEWMNGCAKYFCVPSSLSSKVRVEQRNPKQEEHWSSAGTRKLSGRHMKDVQPWFWEQQCTHGPIQGMLKHWRVGGSGWHLGWTQPISSFPSTKFQTPLEPDPTQSLEHILWKAQV